MYEHVCLELCEAHEADAARTMLDAPPLNALRTEDPERKAALERGVAKAAVPRGVLPPESTNSAATSAGGARRKGRSNRIRNPKDPDHSSKQVRL